MILYVKFHVRLYDGIKALFLDKNAIDGRLKASDDVNPGFVCLSGGGDVGEDVHSLYFNFGYWKPVGIGDAAAEFGVAGLSKGGRYTEAHPQRLNSQDG